MDRRQRRVIGRDAGGLQQRVILQALGENLPAQRVDRAIGAGINLWSDNRLIGLRAGGKQGYSIPRGGLFELVSSPNLMGEIIEWWGFAIMCWNLPALSFAVWTAANLIPRAISHHAWYRRTFADYPRDRRAVIPAVL